MKILHIITGLGLGGAERSLSELIRSDTQNEHRVVSLQNEGHYGAQLIAAGIVVETLEMKGVISIGRSVFRLAKSIDGYCPDVVQCWMYHANLIGGLAARWSENKPAVFWGIRGPYSKQHTPLGTALIIRLCAFLSKILPVAIVSNSKAALDTHIVAGYYKPKMLVIENGYEPKVKDAKEFSSRNGQTVMGMVARYDPHKDHENLLNALDKSLRTGIDLRLLLVGTGVDDANRNLVDMIKRRGLEDHVVLAGPSTDVTSVFAEIDFHILSSDAESFPNVVAEAMLNGVPCISTEVGDTARIMGNLGWLVPPRDSEALAEAIVNADKLIKDTDAYARLVKSCRNRIEQEFSLKRMRDQFLSLWQAQSL